MFCQVQGVVVSVPGEEAAVAEFGGEFERSVSINANSEGSAAVIEAGWIGDAVDLRAGNLFKTRNEPRGQATLMLMNRAKRGFNRGAAIFRFRVSAFAEVGHVFHARGDAGDAFVIQRAPLPAVRNGVRIRTDLVGAEALQVFALSEKHTHVRSEKFVGGASQEVAVEIADVDESVRAVVDGIHVDECAE